MSFVKRNVFISHFREDREEVDTFIKEFKDVFTPKVLGANDNDDFINSKNPEYVMQRIRELYLGDSSVTIVLLGSCTHSRRYIDWEIKSSLQQGKYLPNGLIGIALPSQNNKAHLPKRFRCNWIKGGGGYARFKPYPTSKEILRDWIDDAYDARENRSHLIDNSLPMMDYNSICSICSVTH
jgi:hypothetical protein